MFDMRTIGLKISELRKEQNMTQMELADKMNISFQAVSNWERGNSMPDVAKLPELALIFDVTIDNLLNESSVLINSATKENLGEYLSSNDVSVKEFQQAVPILKPVQIKEVVTHMKMQSLTEIEDMFPYIDKSVLNELALKALDKEDYLGLSSVAWFLNGEDVDKIAIKIVSENKSIKDIAPYVSKPVLTDCAESIYKEHGLFALSDIVVYLPPEGLIKIAEKEYDTYGFRNFDKIAEFLDSTYLTSLAKSAVQKDGISSICPIASYLDKNILSELVKEAY